MVHQGGHGSEYFKVNHKDPCYAGSKMYIKDRQELACEVALTQMYEAGEGYSAEYWWAKDFQSIDPSHFFTSQVFLCLGEWLIFLNNVATWHPPGFCHDVWVAAKSLAPLFFFQRKPDGKNNCDYKSNKPSDGVDVVAFAVD